MGSLADRPLERWDEDEINLPAAGALILPANPKRFYAIIVNKSAVPVWIFFGKQLPQGRGIMLAANGGAYEITRDNMTRVAVYGTHLAGGLRQVTWVEGS